MQPPNQPHGQFHQTTTVTHVQQPAMQPAGIYIQQPKPQGGAGVIVLVIGVVLAIAVVLTVVLAGVLYVWANSLAADQPESGTRNVYYATDTASSMTWGSEDTMIRISWDLASDDLNWAFVVMKLTYGDNTYDCSTGDYEECSISQDGYDDALWEIDEIITLSENGVNICSSTCTLGMYVTYRGTSVSGTSQVTVS